MFTARAERASHGIGGNPSNSGKEEQMGDHHHDLSPVYHSPCKQNTQQVNNNPISPRKWQTSISRGKELRRTIEPINCLLRLVLVLVPHEREPSGVTSPTAIAVDKHTRIIESRTNQLPTPTQRHPLIPYSAPPTQPTHRTQVNSRIGE